MPPPGSPREKAPDASASQLARAVEIGKDLVAHYSTVPEYRALLARCYERLANVARAGGKLPEAADDLAKAVELNKRLAAEFASVPIYRFFLVQLAARIGRSPDRTQPLAASPGDPRRGNRLPDEDSGAVAPGVAWAAHARVAVRLPSPGVARIGREIAGRRGRGQSRGSGLASRRLPSRSLSPRPRAAAAVAFPMEEHAADSPTFIDVICGSFFARRTRLCFPLAADGAQADNGEAAGRLRFGAVAEWFKAPVLKTETLARAPGVQCLPLRMKATY